MFKSKRNLLLQERADLVREAATAFELAEKETRGLSEAEKTRDDQIQVRLDEIKGELERIERQETRERDVQPQGTSRSFEIAVTDPAKDDPKRGFKSRKEFFAAVMRAAKGREDARLKPLKVVAAAGSDEQGEYSNPFGNYLVPEGFSPELLRLDPEDDPMAGRTTPVDMDLPTLSIPARVDKNHTSSVSGGLIVTRKPETVAGTTSRMQFERIPFHADSLFGFNFTTEELLSDSPSSVISLLTAGFSDEFTSKVIDERLNGTGAGEYLGIMNSPALISVAKEAGQAADTILYENLLNMRSRCWRYQNAIWHANHDTLPQFGKLSLIVGTGGSAVYMASAVEDRPDLLLGRPIFYTEYTNTLGDKGDIVLANWSQYLEGTLQPMQSAESMHVRFMEHERAFKFWLRNAGSPWWLSALTPKKSAKTLSPFVVLDAR